jgi:hypothetical protein
MYKSCSKVVLYKVRIQLIVQLLLYNKYLLIYDKIYTFIIKLIYTVTILFLL